MRQDVRGSTPEGTAGIIVIFAAYGGARKKDNPFYDMVKLITSYGAHRSLIWVFPILAADSAALQRNEIPVLRNASGSMDDKGPEAWYEL